MAKIISSIKICLQFCFKNASRAILATLVLSGIFCGALYVFATPSIPGGPPSGGYLPGTELDPVCAPGDANCTVVAPTILSSFSSTATGLTYTNTSGVFSLTSGYVIPTITEKSNWNTAYGWGNHASAGYLTSANLSGYVPYTGGTANVDLGAHNLTVDSGVLFADASNNRVGINTASPAHALDVYTSSTPGGIISLFQNSGNADTAFQVQNSVAVWQFSVRESTDANPGGFNFYYSPDGSTNWVNAMNLTTAGRVGIGTTSPAGALDVNGTIIGTYLSATYDILANRSISTDYQNYGSGSRYGFGSDGSGNVFAVNSFTVGADQTAGTTNIAGNIKFYSAGDNAYYTTLTAGTNGANVALALPTSTGTLALTSDIPSLAGYQPLDAELTSLAGLTYASGAPFVKMTGAGTFALDTNTYLTSLSGALLTTGATTGATSQSQTFTNGVTLSNMTAGSVLYAGTSGVVSQDNSNFFWDSTNHRLGIGTTSPSRTLQVSGSARVTGTIYDVDDTELIRYSNNGGNNYLGIGKKNPNYGDRQGRNLSIGYEAEAGSDSFNDSIAIGYRALAGGGIAIGNFASTQPYHSISLGENATNAGGSAIAIGYNASAVSNGLDINWGGGRIYGTATGNVGIGTTSPSYKLDVNGDVNIASGSHYKINGVNLTYSDVGAQQSNTNLTGLAGLTYASGAPFVKMTGAGTFALDTNTYTSGSGTANQVAYWSGTNALTGGSGFTYDGTTLTSTTTSGAQQRLAYDASNYANSTVDSSGNLTIATATGSSGGNIILQPVGSGNPTFLSDSGSLVFGGNNNTNNEDLKLDFETTADMIGLSSSTGVAYLNTGAINLAINNSSPTAKLDIASTSTSGNDFLITNTGVSTSGAIATITANSATTGNVLALNATGATTGSAVIAAGPASTGVTGNFTSFTSAVGSAGSLIYGAPNFTGAGVTGYGINMTSTDATSSANTDYNIYSSLALSGNAAKTGTGLYSTISTSSTTADTILAADLITSTSGIITTGTRNVYGLRSQPASTGASTGGTTNVYGAYLKSGGTVAAGGTINSYGLYIANGTMNTTGTSTNTGLYVETPSGADNNYAAIFAGGRVGIANTSPGELLTLGTAGTTAGNLSLAGATSGKAIIQVSAVAGTPTLTLPTTSGTLALTSDLAGYQTSLTFANSIQNTAGTVNLVGDVTSPGNSYYYGTNGSGSKGFYALPASSSVSFASATKIPFMNAGGTDFNYSAGLIYDGTTLTSTTTSGAQQRLAYDASNYANSTVSSTGNLTIATATGTTGGDIILQPTGSGNPAFLSDTGYLILGGNNNTNNENLTLDFESVADQINLSSTTGATYINTGSLGLAINNSSPTAKLDIASTSTSGNDFLITNTGVSTSGAIATITANSATTGNVLALNATGATTGSAVIAAGPASTGVTGNFTSFTSAVGSAGSLIYGAPSFTGAGVTGYGINMTATDSTASANTDYNIYGSLALTGNAAKTGYGTYSTVTSSSTTADTTYGGYFNTAVSGAVASGTQNTYGVYGRATASNKAGGTVNVYGGYFKADGTVVSGTINSYGLYVANGTMNTTGTTKNIGLYVEALSGATTNLSAYFGGNVGIGTTSYGANAAQVLSFANGTAPTTSITGTQIWSESGGLKIMGSGNTGTITIPNAVTGTVALGTGTTNYVAYWSGTNTIAAEQYLALSRGGTNNSLTASNGGIVWSDASKLNVLAGTATANQILMSGSSATPAWSTATYPATTTANQVLYSTATNTVGGGAGLTYDGTTLTSTSTGGAQMKVAYDASNYVATTVDSAGNATISTATGTTGGDILLTPATTGNPQLLSDSGVLVLGGNNNTNNQNLNFDFETTSGTVAISSTSTTAATNITWTGNFGITGTYSDNGMALIANRGTSGSENLFLGQSGNSTMTGTNNIFAGYQSGLAITGGSNNVGIGYFTLKASAGGNNNIAIGSSALVATTTASDNVALGYQTGYSNTTGANNFLAGNSAGYSNTTGSDMTAIGYQAGYYFNRAGSDSLSDIFIGYQAGKGTNGTSTGQYNISLGYQTGFSSTTGQYNIYQGYQAGYSATSGVRNIVMGTQAGYYVTTGGSNIIMGNQAGLNNTSGTDNIILGTLAGGSNGASGTASNNIFIGSHAGAYDIVGEDNVFMGIQAGLNNNYSSKNVAIGSYTLYMQNYPNSNNTNWDALNVAMGYYSQYSTRSTLNTNGIMNTSIGSYSLQANTIGARNVALGSGNTTAATQAPLYNNVQASDNIAIGNAALAGNTYASQNIAIGTGALYAQSFANTNNVWATNNVAIGYQALYANQPTANNNGYYNTALGYYALKANTIGNYNIGIGPNSLLSTTTGSDNIAIGYNAGQANVAAGDNTFIGHTAGYGNTYGGKNVAIGSGSLYTQSYANGNSAWDTANVAIGYQALYSNQPNANTNGFRNSAIGYSALRGNTTGMENTALGYNALYSNTGGNYNTAIGTSALYTNNGLNNVSVGGYSTYYNSSGNYNATFGYASGQGVTGKSYSNNSFFGYQSGYTNATANDNTAIGYQASYSNTYGAKNVAIGSGALYTQSYANGSSAWNSENVAVGYQALNKINAVTGITEGAHTTAIGSYAGFNISTGSSDVFLGYKAGFNLTAVSNVLVIDNQDRGAGNEPLTSLIYGVFDASPANQSVRINGSIGVDHLVTGAGGAVAVYRDTNGNLADSTSSIRYKTDVTGMESILPQIMQLQAVRFKWNDQTSTPGVADFGMISEEVNKIMPDLVTYEQDGTTPRGLKYEKMGLFALKGIQELQKEIDDLKLSINPNGTMGDGTVNGIDLSSPFVVTIKNVLAALGIKFGDNGEVKVQKLCVGETCVDETQLKDLLNKNGAQGSAPSTPTITDTPPATGTTTPPSENPPAPPADVLGCMNQNATNYNPQATKDDGSCVMPQPAPETLAPAPDPAPAPENPAPEVPPAELPAQ